jgi:hypothetical protein
MQEYTPKAQATAPDSWPGTGDKEHASDKSQQSMQCGAIKIRGSLSYTSGLQYIDDHNRAVNAGDSDLADCCEASLFSRSSSENQESACELLQKRYIG